MSLKEDAFKYAIKNAFEHEGKADIGAVIGKVKALNKETDIKEITQIAIEAVKEINSLSVDEIKKEFKKFSDKGFELKPKQKEAGLTKLDWAEAGSQGKVITRFAPNPNGPFHLGSARSALLSDEYARMYNGKFLLRFDDTDPKVKKPIDNAEKIFKKDLEWLNCGVDETFFASDRLDIYVNYMKKVIELGKAYVCTCEVECFDVASVKPTIEVLAFFNS